MARSPIWSVPTIPCQLLSTMTEILASNESGVVVSPQLEPPKRVRRKDRGYAFFEYFVMWKNCHFRWFGIFSIPWASKWAPRRSFVHEMSGMTPEIKLWWLQNTEYLELDSSKCKIIISAYHKVYWAGLGAMVCWKYVSSSNLRRHDHIRHVFLYALQKPLAKYDYECK